MIIAVTGRISAGETTFCEILEKNGFKRVSLSDIIREKLREQGKPVVRENLIELGDKIREERGKAGLAMIAWERMKEGDWVVDSIYVPEEFEFLKSKGAYIVGIVAPARVRYERTKNRGEKFSSLEEFIKFDDFDQRWGIDKMVQEADFIIENDGTLEDFEGSVEVVLEAISSSRAQN